MLLNSRTLTLVESLLPRADVLRISVLPIEGGGRVLDCGISAPGGIGAGLAMARVCLADLADVTIVPGEVDGRPIPVVQVYTDHPVSACLASQYAGWQLAEGKFFAMGSGPMRAAYGKEAIFEKIGLREDATEGVVGVLEGRKLPPPAIVARIAESCRVTPEQVTLLIAPTASLAGGLQVVARSIETALHKLSEHDFDLSRIVSAHGTAPLPPVAKDDLAAIGRTNDAILYGARVVLYVTGDDDSLNAVGPKVPARSSRDFGEPFASIFARYNHDFYAVDPHLFSPAEIVFQNLSTGRVHAFGGTEPGVLARSFWS
ncbi:MAG: mch [Planctomycetota bacterium]|nr:mch [Planctomycetota bacterium]